MMTPRTILVSVDADDLDLAYGLIAAMLGMNAIDYTIAIDDTGSTTPTPDTCDDPLAAARPVGGRITGGFKPS